MREETEITIINTAHSTKSQGELAVGEQSVNFQLQIFTQPLTQSPWCAVIWSLPVRVLPLCLCSGSLYELDM